MDTEKILLNMQNLVSKNKIVDKVTRSFQFTDEPKLFQYTAFMEDISKKTDAMFDEENHGSAIDSDENLAKVKALGECIERYCLSVYRKKSFIKKSFNELKRKGLDPLMFINFIKNKEDYISTYHKCKFNWVKCKDYINNKEKLIPAQLVYVPYKEKEYVLRNPISNGAACASSKNEAIYKGICELLERDAFMITYLKKIKAPKIKLKSIKNRDIIELLKKFERYFLKVHLFDITLDINIPTILCILIDNSGVGPAVSIGSKTDLDINKAISGALLEAEHTRTWIRYLSLVKNKNINTSEDIVSLEDRGLYWCDKERIKGLDFLLKSKNKKLVSNQKSKEIKISDKLDKVKKLMIKKGYSIYVKDMTTKKIKEYGFYVVKTIIPELHPLFLFEDLKYYYSNRMNEVSKKMKLKLDLNSEPHPFV